MRLQRGSEVQPLTVACVFVRGHVGFTPEYVIRLHAMCERAFPEHRFVCLTDNPDSLPPSIETIRVSPPRGMFAWWTKVELFNPMLGLSGRVVYLDLDVLVVGDVRAIVNYPSRFALVPDGAPNFVPKLGKKCIKKFNSSVMVWDAGEATYLYSEWRPNIADTLWGDQDWIGHRAPDLDTMPLGWFPRLSEVGNEWSAEAKVVLCKKPKNLIAAQQWPWFNEAWQ